MNLAYVHLILNHIPIVGIPIALSFLLYSLWTKNNSAQRFSLLMLVAIAAVVLPVYYTGEPAEEAVEHLQGVVESNIEAHEEAAEVAFVLTLLTGAAAFLALWLQKRTILGNRLSLVVVAAAVIATGSLLYTANLGGKIRHTEFSSVSSAAAGAATTEIESIGYDKDGDDD